MAAEYVKIAQGLPPRLLRFFARYPPVTAQSQPYAAPSRPLDDAIPTAPNTSSTDPNAPQIEKSAPAESMNQIQNPFLPSRHAVTQRCHGPRFSLRRQADLVKLARGFGIEDCLPPTSKNTAARYARRAEGGLQIRGTGVGQRVKGKRWERTLPARQATRYAAMLRMPKIIQAWKRVGYLSVQADGRWVMAVVGRNGQKEIDLPGP